MDDLVAGPLRLTLAPETGGAIASWQRDGIELLRPVADPALRAQHGRAVAGYPLVPFSNRIAWGRFRFGGETFHLARNFDHHPHTIHGNGWMRPWTVAAAAASAARLTFDHDPPRDPSSEWPYRYHAEQAFDLDPLGLMVTITVENRDSRDMPAGLGLHPYIPRPPGTRLAFGAAAVWRSGPDALPEARLPVDGHWDYRHERPVEGPKIDDCYAGWDGTVRVVWPMQRLALEISAGDPFHHLVVYTPEGKDYMGIEPVSNMTDAINRLSEPDNGLRILRPGESLSGRIRLAAIPLAGSSAG